MNFTIISLITAQSFGISPLFTGKPNLNTISSTFSHFFSPIFYSQNVREYNLHLSSFSFILSTAVVLSSEDQENKKFDKRFSDKGELSKVNIMNCLFLKCTSKENGGGIFIGSSTSITSFSLKSSGFYQCQSKSGDAFYSQTGSMSCQNCCIDKCSNSAFYASEKKFFEFVNNYISHSKLNSDINQSPSNTIFEYVNLTYNTDSIRISSTVESEQILSACEFNSNAGDCLFIISLPANILEFSIQYSNFKNNNFANSIFDIKSKQYNRFQQCFFYEENSHYYARFPSNSQLRLDNCVFSGTESSEKAKFSSEPRFNDCNFVKSLTTNIVFSETKECWNKMPKTLPPIHIDANTIFTFGAVIVLAIGFIFIVCKLRNRNKYNNTISMYTK